MNSERIVVSLAVVAILGCPAPQDTEKPRSDSTVNVFIDPQTPPAAPAPEPLIGKLGTLDALPSDGRCKNERQRGPATALDAELSFLSTSPYRLIRVALRNAHPVSIEITAKPYELADEVETLFAYFGPDDSLKGGNRQYHKAENSANERRDIQPDEGASAAALARQVVERCLQ